MEHDADNVSSTIKNSGQVNQDAARFDQQLDQHSGTSSREQAGASSNGRATQNGASGGGSSRRPGSDLASQSGQSMSARGTASVNATANGSARTAGATADSVMSPPVDIFEDASGFTVMADMPGVSREDLTVRVTGDNLVIEGMATTRATSDVELLYGEASNPHYRRSFTLSRELDPGNIQASMSNGVLKLTIPKAEAAKPRRIEVSVG
jgi:HSP20 family protein